VRPVRFDHIAIAVASAFGATTEGPHPILGPVFRKRPTSWSRRGLPPSWRPGSATSRDESCPASF